MAKQKAVKKGGNPLRRNTTPMLVMFLTPAVLLYLIVFLYPTIRTFIMSFHMAVQRTYQLCEIL